MLDHAARRMLERDISEAWLIETMEAGELYQRDDGRDIYEHQLDAGEKVIIIQVIVDESKRLILSVVDDTDARGEEYPFDNEF